MNKEDLLRELRIEQKNVPAPTGPDTAKFLRGLKNVLSIMAVVVLSFVLSFGFFMNLGMATVTTHSGWFGIFILMSILGTITLFYTGLFAVYKYLGVPLYGILFEND